MTNKEKAFQIAEELIKTDKVKGYEISNRAAAHNLDKTLVAWACHILQGQKKSEERILEELRIEASEDFTKSPEEDYEKRLEEDIVMFPEVSFDIAQEEL